MSGVESRVDQMLDALDAIEKEVGDGNIVIAVYMARLSLAFAASRVSGALTVEEIREAVSMMLSEALSEKPEVLPMLPTLNNKTRTH